MKLFELLQAVSPKRVTGPGQNNGGVLTDVAITSVHCWANEVKPGGLYVAVRGTHNNGNDYIDEALRRGAVAVVSEASVTPAGAIVAEVSDAREALALLAAQFYGRPADKLILIGVTGTNGKTTTTALIESILLKSGINAGVIGTENCRFGGNVYENSLTTPAAPDLQRLLADMAAAGVTHVIMEVSSHALDQKRVAGCRFDVAVFTNITRDHLDYHRDMAQYWACKKLLFTIYMAGESSGRSGGVAVINCHYDRGRELFDELHGRNRISVGFTKEHMVFPQYVRYASDGTQAGVVLPGGIFDICSPLVGAYNLENILCAAGAARATGVSGEEIRAGIAAFTGVPGRLERISNSLSRNVFVDYAHTPDALENVLLTVKNITRGRLLCVFGCGGDRDRSKRPEMGIIAVRTADRVVVTSDNPRSEDPGRIIADILAGMGNAAEPVDSPDKLGIPDKNKRFLVEPDRRLAIQAAVMASRAEDSIVVAGKGSEPYQIINDRKLEFDDRREAEKALRELAEREPSAMCAV